MKGHLGVTNKCADYIMFPGHSEILQLDVVDHMSVYCLDHSVFGEKKNTDQEIGGVRLRQGVQLALLRLCLTKKG